MSDFANYLRVAIQGLSHNTPLSRASAYEKVRKVIRRQLEAGSSSQAEVHRKLEELENAILDMEAEQLMNPIKPGAAPGAVAPPPVAQPQAPVAPVGEQPAAATPVPPAAAVSAPEPAPAPVAPRAEPAPAVAAAPPVERVVRPAAPQGDALAEFQTALTAELSRPAEPARQAPAAPAVQVAPVAQAAPAPVEPVVPAPPRPTPQAAPTPQVREPAQQPAEENNAGALDFDVKQLLNHAIEMEDMRDPATREVVYRRARTALVKHLKSLSPQPDFDTVHAFIEELNAAIRDLETEQVARSASAEAMDVSVDAGDLMHELEDIWSSDLDDPTIIELEPEFGRKPSTPSVKSGSKAKTGTIADEVEAAVQELVPDEPEDDDDIFAAAFAADLGTDHSLDKEVDVAVRELIAADETRKKPAPAPKPKPAAKPSEKAMPPATPLDDLDLDFEMENEAMESDFAAVDFEDVKHPAAGGDVWNADGSFDLPEEIFDEDYASREPMPAAKERRRPAATRRSPRRGGRIVAIVIVLLLLVGAGLAAAFFPDMTSRYVASIRSISDEAVDIFVDLGQSAAKSKGDESVSEAGQGNEPAAAAQAPEQQVPAGSEAGTGEIETAAAPPDAVQEPAPIPAMAPIAGEKAFLYSTTGGQEPIVTGNVAWTEIEAEGRPGGPAIPAIRGDVVVPGERFRATLTLKRNLDPTFPATHMLELLFVPDEANGASAVASVERVSFLESAQNRGSTLVGSTVKIADNIFIIALADIPEALKFHEALFRNPDLIEIQFTYFNGRRSALRLVAGRSGAEVFAAATDHWDGKVPAAAAPQPQPQASASSESPSVAAEAPGVPAQAPAAEPAPRTAAAELGRPLIPDNVPIPLDRP